MAQTNYAATMLLKTDGTRGTSEVVDPLFTLNGTPFEIFDEYPITYEDHANSGTKVTDYAQQPKYHAKSFTGLRIAPDVLARQLACIWGVGTPTAEGTAYRHTWTGWGNQLKVGLIDQYTTSASSSVKYEYGFMQKFGITCTPNMSLKYDIDYKFAKRTLKVANTTLSLPAMTKDLRFSNITAYLSVFNFTPTGGSGDDFLARCLSLGYVCNRADSETGAPMGTYPDAAEADPNPYGDELWSFSTKDTGGTFNPTLKDYGYSQGNASGTLQADHKAGVEGSLHVKFLGAVTTLDATKYFTLDFVQTVQINGGQSRGGVFTGSFKPLAFGTKYLICDVATVAAAT